MKSTKVLSYGLNQGLATNLSCKDVLPSMESVWDQVTRSYLHKEITILLIELETVCEHLPSTLSIWITKKYLKIKGNFQL